MRSPFFFEFLSSVLYTRGEWPRFRCNKKKSLNCTFSGIPQSRVISRGIKTDPDGSGDVESRDVEVESEIEVEITVLAKGNTFVYTVLSFQFISQLCSK